MTSGEGILTDASPQNNFSDGVNTLKDMQGNNAQRQAKTGLMRGLADLPLTISKVTNIIPLHYPQDAKTGQEEAATALPILGQTM